MVLGDPVRRSGRCPHCRITRAIAAARPPTRSASLRSPRGQRRSLRLGGADRAAEPACQLAQQGPLVPGRGADEVLEAVPLLVVAVGDRLGGLALQVGDEPAKLSPGMVAQAQREVRCCPRRPPGQRRIRRATLAFGPGNASASAASLTRSSSLKNLSTSCLGSPQLKSNTRIRINIEIALISDRI